MTAQPAPLSISLVPVWAYESAAVNRSRVAARRKWTQEAIVAAMHAWTNAHGRPPRSYEWAPATGRAAGLLPASPARWELEYPRRPATGTVAGRFGSWCNGLRAAGLPPRNPDHEMPRVERIDAARRLAANGMSLSSIADMLGIGKSTVWGYLHAGDCPDTQFGSWNAGLLAAGLTVHRRTWSDDAIVDALLKWAAACGRPPRYADFRMAGDRSLWPDPKTVSTRFGGWRAALATAGLG